MGESSCSFLAFREWEQEFGLYARYRKNPNPYKAFYTCDMGDSCL